ncbi:DUF4149 domain-containing protein [Alkalinema pantanalense CENA528]|uniref:DUF4149 domain-containing protein n=1 Tax=Alkalinema pantanalense TaxID=1620705 RepID=UPI003D6F9F2D
MIGTLALWLSGSLFLDFLVLPSLYWAGMMSQSEFATVGYALFGNFNHFEVLCGAIVLSGFLWKQQLPKVQREAALRNIPLALVTLAIALIFTYVLAPQMSAMGLNLQDGSEAIVPAAMNQFHFLYWGLEIVKLGCLGLLLQRSFRLTH